MLWLFQDAIKHNRVDPFIVLSKGDPDDALTQAECVLEGEISTAGQEHFYMETQSCLVIPKGEKDEMDVYSATQCQTMIQVWYMSNSDSGLIDV